MFFPRRPILILALWLVVFAASLRAESLEELDRVLAEKGSLDAFLADPHAVDGYFQALQKYYGADKMPRDRFAAVMAQLRDIVVKMPELKERLWETTNLGEPFAIEADVRGRGRDFAPAAWNAYFEAWGKSLTADAKLVYDLPADARAKKAQEIFDRIAKEIEQERAKPSDGGSGRVAETRRNAEIFGRVRADAEVRAALAYVLREKLHEEHTLDLFRAGDPDVILHLLEKMRGEPRQVTWGGGVAVPPDLLQILGAQVPPLRDFMAKEDIFPIRMRTTNRGRRVPEGAVRKGAYQAVPLPRRFHGIWKGIPLGECVGGSGVATYVNWLTPERWLTVALKGTALWHIERDGAYHGFVQAVPIQLGGKVYGSLDFGSPLLAKDIQETDPVTGDRRTVKIFDKWMDHLIAQKPLRWEGYVVGQSNAINNAGVLPTVRASIQHALGAEVGNAGDLTHPDPLAGRIIAYSRTLGNRVHYQGSRMIFDAGMMGAGTLRTLTSPATLRAWLLGLDHAAFLAHNLDAYPISFTSEIYETRARHVEDGNQAIELVAKLLRRSPSLAHPPVETRLDPLAIGRELRPVVDNIIAPWLRRGDASWLARAKQFFAFDAPISERIFVERDLPHLDSAVKFINAILGTTVPPEIRSQRLDNHVDRIVALAPSAALIRRIAKGIPHMSRDTATKLIEAGYAGEGTIAEAGEIVGGLERHLRSNDGISTTPVPSREQVAQWFARNPREMDVAVLGARFSDDATLHDVLVARLTEGEIGPAAFLRRIGGTGANATVRSQLGKPYIDRFLALGPTAAEALALVTFVQKDAASAMKLAIYAAQHARSLEEYRSAVDIPLNVGLARFDVLRAMIPPTELDRLVETSMDHFFRLGAGVEDVKQLEARMLSVRREERESGAVVRVVTALKKRAMPLVSGLPQYFRLAAVPIGALAEPRRIPYLAETVKTFLAETQAAAAQLTTGSPEHLPPFSNQRGRAVGTFVDDANSRAGARLLAARLGATQSFEEYLALVGSFALHDDHAFLSDGQNALYEAVRDTLPRALGMPTTADQLARARGFFSFDDRLGSMIVRRLISGAATGADILRVVRDLPRETYGGNRLLNDAVAFAGECLARLTPRPALADATTLAELADPGHAARGAVYEHFIKCARTLDEARTALARIHELVDMRTPQRTIRAARVEKSARDRLVREILPQYVALGATFEDLKQLEGAVAHPADLDSLIEWAHGLRQVHAVKGIGEMKPTLLALKSQLAKLATTDAERHRALALGPPAFDGLKQFSDLYRDVRKEAAADAFAFWRAQLAAAPSAREFVDRAGALQGLAGENEGLFREFLSSLVPRFLALADAKEQVPRLLAQQPPEALREWILEHGSVEDFLRLSEVARFFGGADEARRSVADLMRKNPTGEQVARFAAHWKDAPETQRHIFAEAGKVLPTRAAVAAMLARNWQSRGIDLRVTLEEMASRFFSLPPDKPDSVVEFWKHAGWSDGVLPVLIAETPADLLRALESSLAAADGNGQRREFARELAPVLAGKFFRLRPTTEETNRATRLLGDTVAKEVFVTRALEHFGVTATAQELAMPSVFTRSREFNERLRVLRPGGGMSLVRRACRFFGL